MTKVVTYQRVVNALHAAVVDRGEDFVYTPPEGAPTGACLNWHEDVDKPGCIVGYVLHSLGATKEQLAGKNPVDSEATYAITASNTIHNLETEHGWVLGDEIATLLTQVQKFQDVGEPWGEAVRKGIKVMEGMPGDRSA